MTDLTLLSLNALVSMLFVPSAITTFFVLPDGHSTSDSPSFVYIIPSIDLKYGLSSISISLMSGISVRFENPRYSFDVRHTLFILFQLGIMYSLFRRSTFTSFTLLSLWRSLHIFRAFDGIVITSAVLSTSIIRLSTILAPLT